jgi:hypothetical protein
VAERECQILDDHRLPGIEGLEGRDQRTADDLGMIDSKWAEGSGGCQLTRQGGRRGGVVRIGRYAKTWEGGPKVGEDGISL